MSPTYALIPAERLQLALREVSRVAGAVALHCDRTEHNESPDGNTVREAAHRMRYLAVSLAEDMQVDLVALYASRLAAVEYASHVEPLLPSPAAEIGAARTWRGVQLAQLRHDRHYHPDVFGLSRRDQLIHVTLHLSKLSAAVALLFEADQGVWADFTRRRLPDIALFGVKLSSVAGESIDKESVGLRRSWAVTA